MGQEAAKLPTLKASPTAKNAIVENPKEGMRRLVFVLAQLPCAYGKTVMAAAYAKYLFKHQPFWE